MSDELICRHCDSTLSADSVTCVNCGSPVSLFDAPQTSSLKSGKVIGQVILIAVVLFVGYIYFFPSEPKITAPRPIPVELKSHGDPSVEGEIASLENMWHSNQTHAPIALRLGNLYAARNDYAKAAMYYRAFLSVDNTDEGWEVALDLAQALFAMDSVDAAKGELVPLLKEHPDHSGLLYNLGAIEANLANYAEAERLWSQLLPTNPQGEMADSARMGLERLKANVR